MSTSASAAGHAAWQKSASRSSRRRRPLKAPSGRREAFDDDDTDERVGEETDADDEGAGRRVLQGTPAGARVDGGTEAERPSSTASSSSRGLVVAGLADAEERTDEEERLLFGDWLLVVPTPSLSRARWSSVRSQ